MRYIIGNETCLECGVTQIVVWCPDTREDFEPADCDECGGKAATRVSVMFASELWPEVDIAVRFDVERKALGLPALRGKVTN